MKTNLFEHFLKRLVEWYCDYYSIDYKEFNGHELNDLSKIKVIKLHFFACSTNERALDIFNNFHAMPYGHVESDVYSNLNNLNYFTVDNTRLLMNVDIDQININDIDLEVIDFMVENLKNENCNLISFKPFELVDLSHRWFSWDFSFREARISGSYSRQISPSLIKQEVKQYS